MDNNKNEIAEASEALILASIQAVILEAQLITLVMESNQLMRALGAVRCLGLSSWCIGAGVIRNLVWDHLHSFEVQTPAADIDVVFFDGTDLSEKSERILENKLSLMEPSFNWELVNQASVHRWLTLETGVAVPPFLSLTEGVASWPEIATCVGVTLTDAGKVEIIAPHGLSDLFEMIVRWNPKCISYSAFAARVLQKNFTERWPRVKIFFAEN